MAAPGAVVRGSSHAAGLVGLELTGLVECDTSFQQVGVQSAKAALDLARVIARARPQRLGAGY